METVCHDEKTKGHPVLIFTQSCPAFNKKSLNDSPQKGFPLFLKIISTSSRLREDRELPDSQQLLVTKVC